MVIYKKEIKANYRTRWVRIFGVWTTKKEKEKERLNIQLNIALHSLCISDTENYIKDLCA